MFKGVGNDRLNRIRKYLLPFIVMYNPAFQLATRHSRGFDSRYVNNDCIAFGCSIHHKNHIYTIQRSFIVNLCNQWEGYFLLLNLFYHFGFNQTVCRPIFFFYHRFLFFLHCISQNRLFRCFYLRLRYCCHCFTFILREIHQVKQAPAIIKFLFY